MLFAAVAAFASGWLKSSGRSLRARLKSSRAWYAYTLQVLLYLFSGGVVVSFRELKYCPYAAATVVQQRRPWTDTRNVHAVLPTAM